VCVYIHTYIIYIYTYIHPYIHRFSSSVCVCACACACVCVCVCVSTAAEDVCASNDIEDDDISNGEEVPMCIGSVRSHLVCLTVRLLIAGDV
jgi:hypothetical protein